MNAYVLSKTLHIVFVTSWFAGLFYLPRIFVNMAMIAQNTSSSTEPSAEYARLLLMANKLFRFMTILAVPALAFGFYLWLGVGIGKGSGGWVHAKLLLVLFICGYHHACYSLLKKFRNQANKRSHTWFRWFNEVPVILLLVVVYIVVAKPF